MKHKHNGFTSLEVGACIGIILSAIGVIMLAISAFHFISKAW